MEDTKEKPIKCFYKYRPLADETGEKINEHTRALLEKGELLFSKPGDFNDPFDCNFDFQQITPSDVESLCKNYIGLPQDQKIVDDVIENCNERTSIGKNIHADLNDGNYFRVCAFSSDEKNILMWSHYAKDHKGICVGFINTSEGIKISDDCLSALHTIRFINPKIVMYTDIIHGKSTINSITNEEIEKRVFSKATDWSYEKEYRVALLDVFILKNPIRICTSEISEIIFGLNASEKLINKVREIVKTYPDNGRSTTLYKCVKVDGKYAIDKVEIPK